MERKDMTLSDGVWGIRIEGRQLSIYGEQTGKTELNGYVRFSLQNALELVRIVCAAGAMLGDKDLEKYHQQMQVIKHLEGEGNGST